MTDVDDYPNSMRHLVRILVFIEDETMMTHVVDLLHLYGYAEILQARDPDELGMSLRLSQVDLLVSVSRTEQVFVGHFIRDLRHGLLECHPFPIVIMLLPSAEEDHVRAVIDSGVDDLLVSPLADNAFVKRLGAFVIERRPFTVTHDYIGPNRRLSNRPGTAVAPLVHVPNPMRARALGQDEISIEATLRDASRSLNRLKIQRDGHQIGWLLQNLVAALGAKERDLMAVNDLVSRIAASATEIARRANERSIRTVRDQARKVVEATRAIIFTRDAIADAQAKTLIATSEKLTALIDADFS